MEKGIITRPEKAIEDEENKKATLQRRVASVVPENMKIRAMTPQDYEAVDEKMSCLHRMHVDARPDQYAQTEHVYSREDFEAIVACGQCIALAAEEEGKLIGICLAAIREPKAFRGNSESKAAYIEALYVDETARRCGVARALYEETERRAKEQGAARIELMVWEFNRSALAFYEAVGMKTQRLVLEQAIRV